MSILAMRFHLVSQTSETTPLGAVRLIGEIEGGRGVEPKGALRTIETFGLTLVLEGEGEYEGVSSRRYQLTPGSLILTHPNRPHLFGPPKGQVWSEIFAIFEGPIFEFLVERSLLAPDLLVVQLEDPGPWRERLHEIAKRAPLDQTALVAGWLTEAVQLAQPREPEARSSDWLAKAAALLEANFAEALTAEQVADSVAVGYETFRKEFVRHTGVSPMRFRNRRRLSLAARLLVHTGLPISEIATRLGYPDAFTFSKAFKRHHGLSPTDFRSTPR